MQMVRENFYLQFYKKQKKGSNKLPYFSNCDNNNNFIYQFPNDKFF